MPAYRMTVAVPDQTNTARLGRTPIVVASVLFAASLLLVLFYLPTPVIPVAHPYRAESAVAIAELLVLLLVRISGVRVRLLIAVLRRNDTQILCAIAAFAVWSCLSSVWANSIESILHHTLLWGLYLAVFLTVLAIVRLQNDLGLIFGILSIAGGIIGILCLLDYLSITNFSDSEAFLRVRYGKFGELLSTISPLLLGAAIVSKGVWRYAIVASAILSWQASMFALSKGAFLAGLIGFAVFFVGCVLSTGRRLWRQLAVAAVLAVAFTLAFQGYFSYLSDVPSTSNYLSGTSDPERSSTKLRVFIWAVGSQMFEDHWLLGVGADNFGREFNNTRIAFRRHDTFFQQPEVAEDILVERAHSEPLQVLSELGVIGLALFFAPFVIFGWAVFMRGAETDADKLILWAAIGGMAAFAVSSMVSSFSFRSAQNGAAFFFVFAAAVSVLRPAPNDAGNGRLKKALFAFGILSTILMLGYGASKAAAEYFVRDAESTVDNERAIADYKKALAIDPEYSGAYLSYAARFRSMGDFADAAKMTQKGIEHGIAMSLTYSELAKQRMAAGDAAGAEDAYREGVLVYPRSVYMQTEFALFLESIGKTDAAAEHLDIARSIEPRQAKGWYHLIKDGGLKAFQLSQADPSIMPPAELPPTNATIQYSDNGPGDTPEATP